MIVVEVLKEVGQVLSVGGAQPCDWYLWSGNQTSHAGFGIVLGALICLYYRKSFVPATLVFAFAVIIELYQSLHSLNLIDSFFDLAFWTIGGVFISAFDKKSFRFMLGAMAFYSLLITIGVTQRIETRINKISECADLS